MDADNLTSSQKKLVMWYKCKELFEKGLSKSQIARELGLSRTTVRHYLSMTYDKFMSSESYKRIYSHKLDAYEDYVKSSLEQYPDLSSSQIYDWLRENYPDTLPEVDMKTVYNFVQYVRNRYEIPKPQTSSRDYEPIIETPYGEYAQVDFGERWMNTADRRRRKVYFFVMVMCRSRKKYVFISPSPFNTDLAVYAHEKAFEYFGGKPKKIIYDQDAVLIHDENLGDYILTKGFGAVVNRERFQCIFCRKSDPESKGKVENAVKYVKYNFLRGRTYINCELLNEQVIQWLTRTGNGLKHWGTHLIPDEVFVEEQKHLLPYYGIPQMPEKCMAEYKIYKTNVIYYHGNSYSLPTGSYKNPNSKVWVDVINDTLELYSIETGKLIVRHKISSGKGEYILDPSHRKVHRIPKDTLEREISEYCNYDENAVLWMKNLLENKPRYYSQSLRYFAREMVYFEPSTLKTVFGECLERGLYNAKDFMKLCSRYGKRVYNQVSDESDIRSISNIASVVPDRTNVSQYDQYFV